MSDQSQHSATFANEQLALHLCRSTERSGAGRPAWRSCRVSTTRWSDGNGAQAAPTISDGHVQRAVLCVDPVVHFKFGPDERGFERCCADAVASGANAVVLPLTTLGLRDVLAAASWGFHSRRIILEIRRAAESSGVDIALTTCADDRPGTAAIHDWCDLVDRFNSPAVGMTLDLRRDVLDARQTVEAVQTIGGRVRCIYAGTAMNAEQVEPVLRALTAIRFTGDCVLPARAEGAWLQALEQVNASSKTPTEARHAD